MEWIYLDNNATTAPAPQVVQVMQQAQEQYWANPSSVHRLGQAVRQQIELSRVQLAQLIGCKERELIFTSGGTEANNLALAGMLSAGDRLITTRIEHAAIREPAQALAKRNIQVSYCPVDSQGQVNPLDLQALLEPPPADLLASTLVSIQWANNETGVIQDIDAIARMVQMHRRSTSPARRVFLHVDGTQAVGKIPVNLEQVPLDLLTLAAHKFHGPKGAGALFIRSGRRLRPTMLGGAQERQRRGGTENTAGIIGMGMAAQLAREFLSDPEAIVRLSLLRDRLENGLLDAFAQAFQPRPNPAASQLPAPVGENKPALAAIQRGASAVVNSGSARARLWNTTNVGFARLEAEAILLALSEQGVCASAGAACSSGSLEPSPVLLAMGIPEAVAHGSIRFSISRFTREEEVTQALERAQRVLGNLARVLPI